MPGATTKNLPRGITHWQPNRIRNSPSKRTPPQHISYQIACRKKIGWRIFHFGRYSGKSHEKTAFFIVPKYF